jgi:hypothetical protein
VRLDQKRLNGRLLVPAHLFVAFHNIRDKLAGAYLLENQSQGKIFAITVAPTQKPDVEDEGDWDAVRSGHRRVIPRKKSAFRSRIFYLRTESST